MRQNEMSDVGRFGKVVSLSAVLLLLVTGCGSSSRRIAVGGVAAESFSAEDVGFKVVVGKRQGNQPDINQPVAQAESVDDALVMNQDVSFTSLIRLLPESSENGSFLIWPAFVNGKEIQEVTYSRQYADEPSKVGHPNSERLLGRRTADKMYWFIPLEEVAGSKLDEVSPLQLFRILLELRFANPDRTEQVRVSLRLVGQLPELEHTVTQMQLPAGLNLGKAFSGQAGGESVLGEETFKNPTRRTLRLELRFPRAEASLTTDVRQSDCTQGASWPLCLTLDFHFDPRLSLDRMVVWRGTASKSESFGWGNTVEVELGPEESVRFQYLVSIPEASLCRSGQYGKILGSRFKTAFERQAVLTDPVSGSFDDPAISQTLGPLKIQIDEQRGSEAPANVKPGDFDLWGGGACSGVFGDDV